jgi:hypothetical protein
MKINLAGEAEAGSGGGWRTLAAQMNWVAHPWRVAQVPGMKSENPH